MFPLVNNNFFVQRDMGSSYLLDFFLQPLSVDGEKLLNLARALAPAYRYLACQSVTQFLPTPISESLLIPSGHERGRYLAIDIGITDLRAGIIELLGSDEQGRSRRQPRVQRHLEKSWPIGEHLREEKAEALFAWIGKCIAEVVSDACTTWPEAWTNEIPMGVTTSFPIMTQSLTEAIIVAMGPGFAISNNLDLGKELQQGYTSSLASDNTLPRLRIVAITSDMVATLIAFCYLEESYHKPTMAIIVGAGSNATILMPPSALYPAKRQRPASYRPPAPAPTNNPSLDSNTFTVLGTPISRRSHEDKIVIHTEWSMNGAASPLYQLGFITGWDQIVDAQGEAPGFLPFQYMTSSSYLGELGRIIILEFFINRLHEPISKLPPKLLQRNGLTTAFLGSLKLDILSTTMRQLKEELPPPEGSDWAWTPETANVVYKVAKKIQIRAAGMTAAAIVGLLACTGEFDLSNNPIFPEKRFSGEIPDRVVAMPYANSYLLVGYTGDCIVHFHDYAIDCQKFINYIMSMEFGAAMLAENAPGILLRPCHDGDIIGAGVLAGLEFGAANLADNKPGILLRPCDDGGIIGAGVLAGTVSGDEHSSMDDVQMMWS